MDYARHLASRLRRTIHGPMWHGPAAAEVLAHIGPAEAVAHPVPGAHCAWELVLHMAIWAEIAHERLDGRALGWPPHEEEWPAPPATPTAVAWEDARARLTRAYETLAARVRTMEPSAFLERVPENDYNVATMLDGVVEHGVYHTGQLALIRRALATGD